MSHDNSHSHSHSHRISYTYTNTSSSLSSFTSTSTSTSSTPSSPALARRSSTTGLGIKRWLSTRLPLKRPLPVPRQASSAASTIAGTRRRNSHYDIYNRKVSYPSGCAYTDSCSDSNLNSQFDSTVKIPGNHGHEQEQEHGHRDGQRSHSHSLRHNHFRSFDYDYEYDAANTNTYRNQQPPEAQAETSEEEEEEEESEEDDLTLSDNYAAYCRAFTASPALFHRSQPLPYLPPSDPESWDNLQKGASYTAYDNHQLGESSSDAHLNTVVRAQADGSQIGFLPVGAHGYHPAQWGRVPSPPPGILTPARYEAIQMLERERMEIEKMKRKKRFPTWCMPIRLFVWPWGRSKQC
ncbi:hypothetical protein BDV19DRAFT_387104 [Aspergillus venezuelensis]